APGNATTSVTAATAAAANAARTRARLEPPSMALPVSLIPTLGPHRTQVPRMARHGLLVNPKRRGADIPVEMAAVTVGLPVYNGARHLPSALAGLAAQTYTDLEIVISDNCSTDETEEICRAFAAEDDRVRYIRRTENRGAAWNFNSVVTETSSPYFKWAAA